MAQQCVIAGVVFNDVPAVDIPDSNNVLHSFLDTTIASNAAAASDIANGKLAYVNGSLVTGTSSGGSGIGTLLKTQALGNISTSNTSAEDTGIDVSLSNLNSYDYLIYIISAANKANNALCANAGVIALYSNTNASTKTMTGVTSANIVYRKNNDGVILSRYATQKYGVYVNAGSITNGQLNMDIYKRYSSTYTGTINDTFTMNIYGLNILSLI